MARKNMEGIGSSELHEIAHALTQNSSAVHANFQVLISFTRSLQQLHSYSLSTLVLTGFFEQAEKNQTVLML